MNVLARTFFISALATAPALAQSQPPVTFPGQEPPPPPAAAPKGSGGADLGSAQLYAYVAGGVVQQNASKGALSCTGAGGSCMGSPGYYIIPFARDVHFCGMVGTLGSASSYYSAPGVITVSSYAGVPNSVIVVTMIESSGTMVATPLSFRLMINC